MKRFCALPLLMLLFIVVFPITARAASYDYKPGFEWHILTPGDEITIEGDISVDLPALNGITVKGINGCVIRTTANAPKTYTNCTFSGVDFNVEGPSSLSFSECTFENASDLYAMSLELSVKGTTFDNSRLILCGTKSATISNSDFSGNPGFMHAAIGLTIDWGATHLGPVTVDGCSFTNLDSAIELHKRTNDLAPTMLDRSTFDGLTFTDNTLAGLTGSPMVSDWAAQVPIPGKQSGNNPANPKLQFIIDDSALLAAIDEAERLLASAEIGSQPGQILQSLIDRLRQAFDAAKAVLDDPNRTQDMIDDAAQALRKAIKACVPNPYPGSSTKVVPTIPQELPAAVILPSCKLYLPQRILELDNGKTLLKTDDLISATYQWQKSSALTGLYEDMPGEINSQIIVQPGDTSTYRLLVKASGEVAAFVYPLKSAAMRAEYTMPNEYTAPAVNCILPVSQYLQPVGGGKVLLSVTDGFTYRWYKHDVSGIPRPIEGATQSTFTTSAYDTGTYEVSVSSDSRTVWRTFILSAIRNVAVETQTPSTAPASSLSDKIDMVVHVGSRLNVRATASPIGKVLDKVANGKVVSAYPQRSSGNWVFITYVTSRGKVISGYASGEFLTNR